jgi:hypothetical protein
LRKNSENFHSSKNHEVGGSIQWEKTLNCLQH